MSVDIEKAIKHFYSLKNKGVTYSMNGSRIGTDGTADCSGAVYAALRAGGAPAYSRIPSTDFFHDYMHQLGWELVSENRDWNAQRGDITIWGKIWQSGGAAGHMGMWVDGNNWIECTAWVNGVVVSNHDQRWASNGGPYFYTYRQKKKAVTKPVAPKPNKEFHTTTGRYVAKKDTSFFKEKELTRKSSVNIKKGQVVYADEIHIERGRNGKEYYRGAWQLGKTKLYFSLNKSIMDKR